MMICGIWYLVYDIFNILEYLDNCFVILNHVIPVEISNYFGEFGFLECRYFVIFLFASLVTV